MTRYLEKMEFFWRKHPALLYGLAFLLGCSWALTKALPLLVPMGALALAFSTPWRHGAALGVFLMAIVYAKGLYIFPEGNLEPIRGEGYFSIDSLSLKKTHFGTFWVYKGTLKRFAEFRNVPVALSIPNRSDYHRPPAVCDYWVQGTLKKVSPHQFQFKWDGNTPWKLVTGTSSWAEKRYHAKQVVAALIHRQIDNPRSATLLAGLATGDFDDTHMQYQFGRFGLQHIMAISGFHFSILAAFFSFTLQLFFERKWSSALLIALLSTYFLFLGTAPSILRAWISILIVLGGYLFEKKGNGLNSLGIGLLAVLIYNPLYVLSLGFQFSFAATAAIFLLYPPCEEFLALFLQKRNLQRALKMPLLDQHGFILLTGLRKGLALTLAVNLVALPMMLFYFQKFPLLSLFYNLFFPFLISVAMLLLLVGLMCPWIHPLNSWFTEKVLDLTYNMPKSFDYTIWWNDLGAQWIVAYVTGIFLLGIWASKTRER